MTDWLYSLFFKIEDDEWSEKQRHLKYMTDQYIKRKNYHLNHRCPEGTCVCYHSDITNTTNIKKQKK